MANEKKKAKQAAKKKSKLGAPKKAETLRTDHLREDQWQRMKEEAEIRGKTTWAFIRDCLDWTITALDTKRGDADAFKLFDGVIEKEEENNDK